MPAPQGKPSQSRSLVYSHTASLSRIPSWRSVGRLPNPRAAGQSLRNRRLWLLRALARRMDTTVDVKVATRAAEEMAAELGVALEVVAAWVASGGGMAHPI